MTIVVVDVALVVVVVVAVVVVTPVQVSIHADKKQIKSQYKKLSLIYHPDKPTGNDKLFMKLKKAYDALTDETAR